MNMLAPAELRPFRLRIEDYELLDRAGAFEGRHVELIEGVIVEVNSELLPHMRLKNEIMFRLRLALRAMDSPLTAFVQPTLSLPPHNMPEPDVMVAHPPVGNGYFEGRNALIVVEVSSSTLRGDLGTKRLIYAAHAIPEYWVVDVTARRVHQFWSPADGDYAAAREVPLAGPLASATVEGLAIDGAGIL